MSNTPFTVSAAWPTAASYTSPAADHNIHIKNNRSKPFYWTTGATRPDGEPGEYGKVDPDESLDMTMVSGEKLWIVMPGLSPARMRVIHD